MTNRNPVSLILSGQAGHGKSVAAVSFSLPELPQPKRLAVGFEMGLSNYRSLDGTDHPERLLYAFDFYPLAHAESVPEAADLINFLDFVRASDCHAVIIDNIALMQELVCAAMDQAEGAAQILEAFGLMPGYRMVKSGFGRGLRDQTYWRAVKDVLRTLILEVRKSRKHLICTTEQKNVWQNYGSRDPNNPAKIIGQTAKVLDPWLRYTDGILQLSRTLPSDKEGKPRLSAVPFAQVDAFNPKNRLVGLPPRFEMSWSFLWKCVDERLIPTQAEMDKMVMTAPQVVEIEEPAVPAPDVEQKAEAEVKEPLEVAVPGVVLCTHCERPITGGTDKDGRPYTAQRMVDISSSKAGSPLCYTCYKAYKEFKASTEQILGQTVIVTAVPAGGNGAH